MLRDQNSNTVCGRLERKWEEMAVPRTTCQTCKFEPIKDVHRRTSKSAIRINNAREENVGLKVIPDNTI